MDRLELRLRYCKVRGSWLEITKSFGSFILDGISPAPRGVPSIQVTFHIDATALDKATGNKKDITITGASILPKDEVSHISQNLTTLHALD